RKVKSPPWRDRQKSHNSKPNHKRDKENKPFKNINNSLTKHIPADKPLIWCDSLCANTGHSFALIRRCFKTLTNHRFAGRENL
ncbi:hypothetical protein, partial [Brucella abortus]|uniref:hypothetical protein n=1 Tax=Brucella abortus TaxID=235 RepID=UPI003D2DA075